MVTPTPVRVRLRAYQVGFGDCLLLTVGYARPLPDGRTEGHILVDFGAKVLAKGGPRLADIGRLVAEHCGGHLDVVVATHRHQDHLRGFGDATARNVLDPLQPDLILRPWPDMPPTVARKRSSGLGRGSREFLGLLEAVADSNARVVEQFDLDRTRLATRAKALAELGVSNVQALAMLDEWVPADRTAWVRYGDRPDVADRLPGVTIEVLGPPTLEQVPGLRSYASSSSEYWLGMAAADRLGPELERASREQSLDARGLVAPPDGLGAAAWLVDKMQEASPRQVLEIVEGFEDVLNNTSVVLLVTVGRRRILLAGDAQVEGWSYALDLARGENGRSLDAELRRALTQVDLYKVGHHGSRNATPKRLVDLWRTTRRTGRELCSVLSTRSGVYGTTSEGKVPKTELVEALRELGPVRSTEDLPPQVWWLDVESSTRSAMPDYVFTEGPPQGTTRR